MVSATVGSSARIGSGSASDGFPDGRDQRFEVAARELLAGSDVLLHAPLPIIEVDIADRVLDRRPQRPRVLRDQAEQPRPGCLARRRPAQVSGYQVLEPVDVERGLAPDVAEFETRVVVAGVL